MTEQTSHPTFLRHQQGEWCQAPIQSLRIILQRMVAFGQASSEFTRLFRFADSPNAANVQPDDGRWISLKQLHHPTQLVYGSALPQQLGREQAAGVASWLVDQCDRLRQGTHPLLEESAEEFSAGLRSLLREFTVMATPAATLRLQWHDRAIAHWLTVILTADWERGAGLAQPGRSLAPSDLWTVQYAHARCCAILRHAQAVAWIPLVPSADAAPWCWAEDTVPWLTDFDRLTLWHPSQFSVMVTGLALLDQWTEPVAAPSPTGSSDLGQHEWRLAEQLSHAFQTFYAACPPFAMVRWRDRDQACGYIALITAIQRLLWWVLMRRGAVIPMQL